MSELIVIGFDSKEKAEEVRLALFKMQQDFLVDLEDCVIVVKDEDGKVKLHQVHNLTAAGAVSGGFWGALIGCLFLSPLLGAAVGAAAGAASGALTDIGIDDNFMKELGANLEAGSSALFVLVRKATPDKVLEQLSQFEGKVLRTSLTHEEEEKLQAVLDKAKQESSEC